MNAIMQKCVLKRAKVYKKNSKYNKNLQQIVKYNKNVQNIAEMCNKLVTKPEKIRQH